MHKRLFKVKHLILSTTSAGELERDDDELLPELDFAPPEESEPPESESQFELSTS